MSEATAIETKPHRPLIPRLIRTFAIPVIIAWFILIFFLNTAVPQLDEVGKMRSVSMAPDAAPSVIAMKHIGTVFDEFKSNSSIMIVLEGDQPLDKDAHAFYDDMVRKLEADTKHVEHVQDFWSDPLTAAGSQSNDGKAAYVQVYLRGNQGEALANESVEATQQIVHGIKTPPGMKAYVTGPAALAADQHIAGDRSVQIIEGATFGVIILMLLLVYRSVITVLLTLVMVVLQLSAARGVVAFLGFYNIIGLSTFATNLLVTLAIAAATDYVIFLIGRYQEARGAGESREDAYYTMYHGTAHVVLGSGLTIAGATFCLHFTRMPYFQSLGIPLAIGMVIVVFAALTLGPAVISLASRFRKTLEPKRAMRVRGWRKIGAAVVRWPAPILVGTVALLAVGGGLGGAAGGQGHLVALGRLAQLELVGAQQQRALRDDDIAAAHAGLLEQVHGAGLVGLQRHRPAAVGPLGDGAAGHGQAQHQHGGGCQGRGNAQGKHQSAQNLQIILDPSSGRPARQLAAILPQAGGVSPCATARSGHLPRPARVRPSRPCPARSSSGPGCPAWARPRCGTPRPAAWTAAPWWPRRSSSWCRPAWRCRRRRTAARR